MFGLLYYDLLSHRRFLNDTSVLLYNYSILLNEVATGNNIANNTATPSSTCNPANTCRDVAIENRRSIIYSVSFFSVILLFLICLKYLTYQCIEQDLQTVFSHHLPGLNLIDSEDYIDGPKLVSDDLKYESIEASLVNMFVIEHHDDFCPYPVATVMDPPSSKNDDQGCQRKQNQESFGDDHEIKDIENQNCFNVLQKNIECSICLDYFKEGDVVSISPFYSLQQTCHHVFHHICIKEWLLKHSTCPTCRQEFLFNDSNNHFVALDDIVYDNSVMRNDASQHSFHHYDFDHAFDWMKSCNFHQDVVNMYPQKASFFFCLQHGIMQLPSSKSHMNQQGKQQSEDVATKIDEKEPQIICLLTIPNSKELVELRLYTMKKRLSIDHTTHEHPIETQ
jgi:Ring finger domain